jgi:hypothetical protein
MASTLMHLGRCRFHKVLTANRPENKQLIHTYSTGYQLCEYDNARFRGSLGPRIRPRLEYIQFTRTLYQTSTDPTRSA